MYQNLPNNSIARLRELKGKYNGERCFIVGNGPSLRKMDLSLLKNEFGIVFNGAFELREYFAPDKLFHAVEDRLVLEDHQSAINELTGNVFLPSDLQHLVMSGNPIVTEFHRGFPESSENWPPVLDTSSDLPVFFWGGTVAYYGLQLAMWLGFEEVYFIGMDLSYSIPDSVKRKGNVLESTEDDPNHYKSSYFGAGLRWHVPRPERMLVAFEKAAQRNLSVRIYNAGVGGNLNCFTRVSYESLF
ncbi:hypothetical protein [Thalassolituus sp.]|uniref:hypothetical protein n=1 Tax=Thalassolituus sp. TaxID=2030822 RepID=UPI002A809E3F|nr:hypothetical protein [Thalassolituus sp.]